MERIKREVFDSRCFDQLRKMYPNFNEIIDRKIVPVEGDIVRNRKHWLMLF